MHGYLSSCTCVSERWASCTLACTLCSWCSADWFLLSWRPQNLTSIWLRSSLMSTSRCHLSTNLMHEAVYHVIHVIQMWQQCSVQDSTHGSKGTSPPSGPGPPHYHPAPAGGCVWKEPQPQPPAWHLTAGTMSEYHGIEC